MAFGFAKLRRLILEQLENRVVFDAAPGAELLDAAPPEEPAAQLVQVREVPATAEAADPADDPHAFGSASAELTTRRELVIIDPTVEDAAALLDAVEASFEGDRQLEVLMLDPARSGIERCMRSSNISRRSPSLRS